MPVSGLGAGSGESDLRFALLATRSRVGQVPACRIAGSLGWIRLGVGLFA